jgi:hypothetical protein
VFGGIKPAVHDLNTQPQQAQRAHNTPLRDTQLKSFRTPLASTASRHFGDASAVKSLHMFPDSDTCCSTKPVTFDRDVSVVHSPDPGGCHGFEGVVIFPCDGTPPYRYFRCEDETYPLVVPQPVRTPRVTLLDAGTLKDAPANENKMPDERSYTYTWVDRFGVESPPAPPSASTLTWDDQVFRVDQFDTAPANAACIRIYRSVSPFTADVNAGLDLDASFQLVEEVAVTGGSPVPAYTDLRRLRDMELGTLLTYDNCPPPVMDQVVTTEMGYAVGFHKNRLFISERYEPHNFPERYRFTLPDRIVGLAAHYDTVFIGTTGRPYRTNVSPAAASGSRDGVNADMIAEPVPYTENYPCLSRWTMVSTNFGAMYGSHKGMVALAANGNAVLSTRDRVDEDDWVNFMPNIGAWHNGKYYGSRSPVGVSFVMDVPDTSEGALDIGDFVTIDWHPTAVHSGPDGQLWYLEDVNGAPAVHVWDAGPGVMSYEWVSKTFRQPGLMQFSAAKVVGSYGPPVVLTIYADGRIFDEVTVENNRPFRLRRNGRAINWSFRLQGSTVVNEVHIATSMTELAEN